MIIKRENQRDIKVFNEKDKSILQIFDQDEVEEGKVIFICF